MAFSLGKTFQIQRPDEQCQLSGIFPTWRIVYALKTLRVKSVHANQADQID